MASDDVENAAYVGLCPHGECDGSGKISYETHAEHPAPPEGYEGEYIGSSHTYGSRLCRCRLELEPREGEARWWDSKTIFAEEWNASVFDKTLEVVVRAEVPISDDNYLVAKRGNRYYPTFVDIGEASFVFPDEARELARLLIAAADACDAYDKPDTTDGGTWWFPEPEERLGFVWIIKFRAKDCPAYVDLSVVPRG